MWDHLPTDALIQHTTAGNYGLAARRWQAQLQAIRDLLEYKPDTEDD